MARRIIQFNILAVSTLIFTVCLGGQVVAVENNLRKANLLANIAVQYAAAGKPEQAAEVLEQTLPLTNAITNECFKANPLSRVALGYILVGQEAKGKQLLTEAIQIARTQTATGCSGSATSPDESLLNRAREYAEAGYYEFARTIIIEVNNPMFTPITLAELAGYYAKNAEAEQATKVLNQAIAIAQRNDRPLYRTMTLIGIAEHLTRDGQKEQVPLVLERALESASAIDEAQASENSSMKVHCILRIAKQFATVGQERRAIELLDRSLPKIRTLANKPFPLDKIIQLIATATQYAVLEEKNKAVETLAEARTAAQAIPIDAARSQSDALARVAKAYAELGNFDGGQQIARSIKNVNEREQAFGVIAIAYAKAGYSDQAIKLAKSIGKRDYTLKEIARYYLNSGQYDQAFEIVQQWNLKDILSEVAFGYLEAGQPERALQIAQSIQSPPDAIQHKDWRLPAIARGFAKQRKFDRALQVAQGITDKSYKAEALTAIAEQYVVREPEKTGIIQKILSILTNSVNSLFGSSDKDKASEILDRALQVAESITTNRSPH
ncbi:hypothetical protein NUACC21_59010 [Scytonema sp. NUACC21]